MPRTKEQAGALSDRLRAYGAVPEEVPTIAVEPPRTPQQMERAIKGLVTGRYEWVAFTSRNAVKAVRERFEEYGLDARAFAGIKVAAVGEQTAADLLAWGIKPDLVPSGEQSAAGLLEDWPPYDAVFDPIDRVFLPRADIATENLVAGLVERGWEVDDVTAYRTVRAAPPAAPNPRGHQERWLRRGRLHVVLDGAQPGRHRGQAAPVHGDRVHRPGHREDGGGARPAGRRPRPSPSVPRPGRGTVGVRRVGARRRRGRRGAGAAPVAEARHRPPQGHLRSAWPPLPSRPAGRGGCAPRRRCGALVAQTRPRGADLVLPLFVREGLAEPAPIASMPGVVQHSRDSLRKAAVEAVQAGVGGLMLFGVPSTRTPPAPARPTTTASSTSRSRDVVAEVGDATVVMSDLCLDEFTDHGHCGVLDADGRVDNDATLVRYAEMGLAQAAAGAHVLGPSGMMDGQVGVVRAALDADRLTDTAILAYTAKYASAFFGPFREAVESTLQGDRRTYQQDPANADEALRELALDLAEGADIVMVKPALPYLDVLRRVADEAARHGVPVAAYQVSGEYAMAEAAFERGWLDRERTIVETLTSVRRAGAGVVLTYWAVEAARLLQHGTAHDQPIPTRHPSRPR